MAEKHAKELANEIDQFFLGDDIVGGLKNENASKMFSRIETSPNTNQKSRIGSNAVFASKDSYLKSILKKNNQNTFKRGGRKMSINPTFDESFRQLVIQYN